MASSSWVVFASILTAQALCYASGRELPTAPRSVNDYIERNVKFYIFNSDSPAGVKVDLTVDSLVSNGFNKSLSTTVVIHGYGHDITDPLYANVAAALVDVRAPTNVLGVDWGVLCPKPLYLTSRSRVGSVGAVVAKLLQLLVDNGLADAAGLHLIGHSLGAHVAANAAKILKVGRISGLDPALPLFYDWSMDRLKPTDADFVDVIHTSSGKLGYKVPTGHADFYPNGGKVSQPGCEGLFADGLLGSCSHQRAHELYGASIGDPAAFASEKCDSYEQAMAGTCINSGSSGSPAANMGYYVTPSTQGVYYVKTTGTKPFKTN